MTQVLNEVLSVHQTASENSLENLKITIKSQKMIKKSDRTIDRFESTEKLMNSQLISAKNELENSNISQKIKNNNKRTSKYKSLLENVLNKNIHSKKPQAVQNEKNKKMDYLTPKDEKLPSNYLAVDKSNKWAGKDFLDDKMVSRSREPSKNRNKSPQSRNFSKENTVTRSSKDTMSKVKQFIQNLSQDKPKQTKEVKGNKKNSYINQYLARRKLQKKSYLPSKVKKKEGKKAKSRLMSLYISELKYKSKKKLQIYSEKAKGNLPKQQSDNFPKKMNTDSKNGKPNKKKRIMANRSFHIPRDYFNVKPSELNCISFIPHMPKINLKNDTFRSEKFKSEFYNNLDSFTHHNTNITNNNNINIFYNNIIKENLVKNNKSQNNLNLLIPSTKEKQKKKTKKLKKLNSQCLKKTIKLRPKQINLKIKKKSTSPKKPAKSMERKIKKRKKFRKKPFTERMIVGSKSVDLLHSKIKKSEFIAIKKTVKKKGKIKKEKKKPKKGKRKKQNRKPNNKIKKKIKITSKLPSKSMKKLRRKKPSSVSGPLETFFSKNKTLPIKFKTEGGVLLPNYSSPNIQTQNIDLPMKPQFDSDLNSFYSRQVESSNNSHDFIYHNNVHNNDLIYKKNPQHFDLLSELKRAKHEFSDSYKYTQTFDDSANSITDSSLNPHLHLMDDLMNLPANQVESEQTISIKDMDPTPTVNENSPIINKEIFREVIFEHTHSDENHVSKEASRSNNKVKYFHTSQSENDEVWEGEPKGANPMKTVRNIFIDDQYERFSESDGSGVDHYAQVPTGISYEEIVLDRQIAVLEEAERKQSDSVVKKQVQDKIRDSLESI